MEVSKEELLRAARDEGWSELVARPPIDENRADDIAAAVGMIRAGISALAEAGIDGVDDRNLLDSVLDVERETAPLSAAQGKLLAEVDVRRAYGIEGCVTTASWLGWRANHDQPDAARRVRTAKRLRYLDHTRQALEDGEITARHAEVIALATTPRRMWAIQQCEKELVDIAREIKPKELRRALDRVRETVDPDGSDPEQAPAPPGSDNGELYLAPTLGGVDINGHLGQLAGEGLLTLIDALEKPDPPETPADRIRTPAQRRADAFAELIERMLALPDLPSRHGRRPQIILDCDLMTLLGQDEQATRRPRLKFTGEIDPDLARCFAANGDPAMLPVLMMGPWRAVNVGRAHRVLPTWLRDVLHSIHRHCRGPGCDRPANWTDAAHLNPHAEGGNTDLDETIPGCDPHHDNLDRNGWNVDYQPDTAVTTWTDPRGETVIRTHPPPP